MVISVFPELFSSPLDVSFLLYKMERSEREFSKNISFFGLFRVYLQTSRRGGWAHGLIYIGGDLIDRRGVEKVIGEQGTGRFQGD